MIKTTVVIPNYNGIKYIEACLEHLQKANREEHNFNTIVVDNGSTDGSLEIVRDKFTDVKLIELSENTGFAYAVNRGIEVSDTEYVILLNNDVNVDVAFVENLEKAMDSDSKLFSVNSLMMSMSDNDVLDGAGDYYCALGWAYAYKKGKKTECLKGSRGVRKLFSACGGASIYRKSVFDEIGLFDEEHFAYLEDVDVGYRARIAGYKNVLCSNALCEHAGSGSSGSRYNEFKIKLSSRNNMYMIIKNMPLLQLVINLPLLIIGFAIKTLFFARKKYGKLYLNGLCEGVKLAFSENGRKHWVKFRLKYLMNYVIIQLELWINIVRRITA